MKQLLHRAAITVALTALLTAGGAVATSSPANAAAPPCRGATCNGKDPDATGCGNDAITLNQKRIWTDYLKRDYGYMQNRYSARCRSGWIRTVGHDGKNEVWHATHYVENRYGQKQDQWDAGGIERAWSLMVNAIPDTRVCGWDYGLAENVCGGWA